jgi:hypothetical protein
MKKIIGFLTFLLISPICFAEFRMGNDLKNECQSNASITDQMYCLGYIAGVSDANKGTGKYCLPPGVTQGQLKAVVSKYFNEYPENLHYTADSLIIDAFKIAFPCSRRRN